MSRTRTYCIGIAPDPKDRRTIEVDEWGADRIASLGGEDGPEVTGITDLITGEDLMVERIDCGLGQFGSACRCALGIVGQPDPYREEVDALYRTMIK